MVATVSVSHYYDAAPQAVWDVATDFACFAEAMKGIASFEGMPETGRAEVGQVLEVKVRLFGWMPPMDYHMEVVSCDHGAHTLRSVEHGGAVRSWEHHLSVTPEAGGATLTDHITLDAGLMTPLLRLWARFIYTRRHAPRVRMLSALKEA